MSLSFSLGERRLTMATVPSAMVATRSAPASAGRARRPALSARAARSGPQPQRGSRGRARSNWPEPSVVPTSRRACLGLERRAFGRKGPIVVARAAETPDVKGKSSNQPASFFRVRLFTFIGILVGYSCYYLTRNSLTYTAPVMVASKDLGLDVSSIGAMTSIFPIAYGMSKFVSGVLGSMMSASRLLGLGLICTGLINVCFGFGSSLAWFCTLWAMNGILQGVGGPCCARILTSWFATEERGTYWGMWNIAHNLGGGPHSSESKPF